MRAKKFSHVTAGILISLIFSAGIIHARTIPVPGEHSTIQGAIDISANGDTVLVYSGEYAEHLDFNGKKIIVISSDGPDSTWIKGDGTDAVISFTHWENTETKLIGFTVAGGAGRDDDGERKGGAVYSKDARPILEGNVFMWNTADKGGAVYSDIQAVTLLGNTFKYNSAASGGAAYLENNLYDLDDNLFLENSSYKGGAVFFRAGTLESRNNLFESNHAREGGCIYIEDGSLLSESSSYFKNAVCENGGAVWATRATVEFSGDMIMSNTADRNGGGLYLVDCTATADSSLLSCNTCEKHGGNLYGERTCVNIARALVRRGEADYGAGVYLADCTASIVRTIIEKNRADLYGGGIFASTSELTCEYNTFDDNGAPEGGSLFLSELHAGIRGCSITHTKDGGAIDGSLAVVNLEYNNLFDNEGGDYIGITPGANDIYVDPLYVNADSGGDYRLLNGSPCIDAGPVDDTDPDDTRADIGRFFFDQAKDWILYLTPDKYHIGLGETAWIEWTVINRLSETVTFEFEAQFVTPTGTIRPDKEGAADIDPTGDDPFSLQRFFYYYVPESALEGVYRYQVTSDGDLLDECLFRIET